MVRLWRVLAACTVFVALAPPTAPAAAQSLRDAACESGAAGTYPCLKVDLLAYLPMTELGGGGRTSDVWGWADRESGKEYALVGSTRGLLFVDVTNPLKPVYLGNLVKPESALIWQDVEVYKDHAFVVCDLSPCGLQIFDLTRIRDATAPQPWTPNFVYPVSVTTHTLDIDPDTGFLYLNGSYLQGGSQILDISDPTLPRPAGFIQDDGYTHDTHCRIYEGPDRDYRHEEVCFAFNEDTITVYDMADKSQPRQIERVTYENASYVHSGWLTKDHSYLLSTDEGDETSLGIPGTTYMWDVRDLDKIKFIGAYEARTAAIDHNVFVKGRYVYHASYTAGLRILDAKKIAKGKLKEVGYFDVMPESDNAEFNGSWSVYPYLPSGTVLVGGMSQGLFLVRPDPSILGKI